MSQSRSYTTVEDNLFGTLAVRYNFVLEHQIGEALEVQQSFYVTGQPAPKLGEILAQKGYMTHEQIAAVLRGQSTGSAKKRFGEFAVTHHFCSQQEVDAALKVQNDIRGFGFGTTQKIGEILVARGALRPHQVSTILQNQGVSELITCPSCQTALNIAGLQPTAQVRCPSCNVVFVPSDLSQKPAVQQPRPPTTHANSITRQHVAVTANRPQHMAHTPHVGATQLGSTVGQYQIESKLGEDSTGVLYKAFDPHTGVRVALRMLDPGMVTRPDDYEHWVTAEQAARELSHRNLQRILAMNTDRGRPYLVMDFIDGDSLRKIMNRRGVFPAVDAVGMLVQLAEALEYGASRGLLHGDLRPVHVILGVDGVIRLSGLGIPKNAALNLRQVAGQFSDEALPLYTPPEVMIDPEQADERSDIYSLGAIGYHMLTGRPPHEGTGLVQLGFRMAASKITPAREVNPRIPEFVSKLIGRCLQLDANLRYDSPTLLLNDLRKARTALMAGDDASELTESLRTSNFVPVAARRAPRLNRLKRLKTHLSRPAHGSHALHGPTVKRKPAGHSSHKLPIVGAPTPQFKHPGGSSGLNSAMKFPGRSASGIVPAVGLPGVHGAGSSSSIPAVVSSPPRSAASSSMNSAVTGIPLSQQITPRETISDLGDDLVPGATPARRHNDAGFEVIKQLDVNMDPVTGNATVVSKRQRPARQVKRVSNSAIVLTCVISVIVIGAGIAGIYFSYAGGPAIQVVEKNEKLLAPKVTVTPNEHTPEVEEAQDWHAFELYAKDNAKNPKGLVDHLRLYTGPHPTGEHAAKAKEDLAKYAAQGAEQSLPTIRETVKNALKTDGFADANTAIEKWRDEWKEAKDIAALEKSLKDEVIEGQKASATALMDSALALRKDQKYAEAKALYDRIKLNFPTEFKNQASKAQLESEAEQSAAKTAAQTDEKNKKEQEAKADREAAAPAIFDRLSADVSSSYKTFDLKGAAFVIDANKDALVGTAKEGDYKKVKAEWEQLSALRDRMSKAIKDGKMRDQRVKYHDQLCILPDANAEGPILQVGAGTVPVKWPQIAADDLSDIAGRATEPDNAEGLLQVGMLRYYTGKYVEAFQAFSAAQKLKADASKWIDMTQAALKDTEARDEKAHETATAEAQAETVKALAAAGLEIRHGIWKVSGNSFLVSQDAHEPKPDLMSMQRKIKKTFKSISIEVRGTGETAGFSFSGEGRRFVLKPGPNWQKVTVERGATGVVMKVDDEEKPSVEKIAFDVTPATLVSDGIIYIRFIGQKGEFRNLQVDE